MSVTPQAIPEPGLRSALLGALLAVLLAVFAAAPLSHPGFFEARSGFLPVYNLQHLDQAPNWGRAADPVRGEGKLPYLLAWPLLRASGRATAAVKGGYALAFGLAALAAYAWTRRWLGTRGAVLAAAVYTYLPWHLDTVYVRGALADAWLWVLWPAALAALDRLRGRRPLLAAAVWLLALGASVWAQAGLTLLFLALAAAYTLALLPGRWRSAGGLGGVALAAVGWALAVRQAPPTPTPASGRLLFPSDLLLAGGEAQLGVAGAGLSLMAVALWAGDRRAGEENPRDALRPALRFWLPALGVVVLLALGPAAAVWRLAGLDALLAEPGQLLALAGLPLAFLAGSAVRLDRRLAELPAWAGLLALVVLAALPSLEPRFTLQEPGAEPLALLAPAGEPAPAILLVDADISPPAEIAPTLVLTLTWQAVRPVPADYTVFCHLLDAGGTKLTQRDARPCDGACPTSAWQPGDLVVDHHVIPLPDGTAPGPYRLALGLYLLDTGERVAVAGRQDGAVILDVP